VSCITKSKEELDNKIPVKPPIVKRKINPNTHKTTVLSSFDLPPMIELNHEKTLIPVGTAIIIVAPVK
jgi:hypothetical protein